MSRDASKRPTPVPTHPKPQPRSKSDGKADPRIAGASAVRTQAHPTALRIETIPIGRLNPAPYNPRLDLKPGDPEYERLARSVAEFGLVEPLVWNRRSGNLVGGHQRLKVLIARGDTTAQVSVVDLSPEREKALNLALNKIAGDWDPGKLAAVLDELGKVADFDVSITGFELPEIDAIIAAALADDPRQELFDIEAEMARAAAAGPPVTKAGDMILLGRDGRLQHRLLCADSTDANAVRRLMSACPSPVPTSASCSPTSSRRRGRPNRNDQNGTVAVRSGAAEPPQLRAALFATDPPYLVGYDGTNHPGTGKSRSRKTLNRDWSGSYCATPATWDDPDANPELYNQFVAVAIAEAIRPDAALYCWHASKRQGLVEASWSLHGVLLHQQIIWVKPRPVLNRSWYTWQHEPCLMGWIQGNKPHREERAVLSTVWEVAGVGQNTAGGAGAGNSAASPTPIDGASADSDHGSGAGRTPRHPEPRPDHPTPKPTELFEIPMRQHTRPGEICYEPFAGSGSQIIAAERTGRRCFAVEISPTYCDVIVRRYIAYAGEAAVAPEVAARYRIGTTGHGRGGQSGGAA